MKQVPLESSLRVFGAVALLMVGAIHLEQFVAGLSVIPLIGPLFLLNFAGSTLVAVALIVPFPRLARRQKGLTQGVLALGGVSIALVGLAFVLISEYTTLFGVFMENGYRPEVIIAIVSELATAVLLGGFLVEVVRSRRIRRTHGSWEPLRLL
jgi:hypothetical protein